MGTGHKSAHSPWIFFEEMLLQQKGAGGGAGGGIGGGAGGGGGGGSVEAERKALEAPVGLDDGSMHGSYGSYCTVSVSNPDYLESNTKI